MKFKKFHQKNMPVHISGQLSRPDQQLIQSAEGDPFSSKPNIQAKNGFNYK